MIVDVGPELSDRGRAVIAGFVRDNEEFDDLEHFVRNVQQYDPYRSRAHIERTVKYNMLQRADGKFVSKCDANPRRLGIVRGSGPQENITLDEARAFDLPVLLVRGADSRILTADAAERFRDCVAARNVGHGAELRPQRARSEHQGVHRGGEGVPCNRCRLVLRLGQMVQRKKRAADIPIVIPAQGDDNGVKSAATKQSQLACARRP